MKSNLKTMLQVALLVAVEIVLSRFCSISTPFLKIGLAFLPLAVCGMLFGPVWGLIAGGLADFLGAILFPIGPYFPGFTLSTALTGLVFGLCLYRRNTGWLHIALAVAVNNFVISLFVTTFWIHLLYGSSYLGLLLPRLGQNLLLAPIEFVLIKLVQKPVTAYAALAQSRT